MQKKYICVCMLLFVCVSSPLVHSQSDTENVPAPYTEDEFATWLQSVRRFEIIAIGSFPLTYFVTLLVYDLYKFTAESINSGFVNPLYAPLFFAPSNKPPPTQEEITGIVLTSVGISLLVAVVDTIIQDRQRKDTARRAERQQSQRQQNITETGTETAQSVE